MKGVPKTPTPRKSGRFIKQKVLDKRRKAAANRTLQAAKVRDHFKNGCAETCNCVVKGLRVVDCCSLKRNMRCTDCDVNFSFNNIEKEKKCGLASIWSVRCPSCKVLKNIHTSESPESLDKGNCKQHIVNVKLAAGNNYNVILKMKNLYLFFCQKFYTII